MSYDEPDFEHALGVLILVVIAIVVSSAIATVGYFTGIRPLMWIGMLGVSSAIAFTIWKW